MKILKSIKLLTVTGLAGGLLAVVPDASAQLLYTSGHGDVGVEYEDEEFEPHWHLEGNIVGEFDPGAVIAQTGTPYTTINGMSDALGVPTETEVFAFGRAGLQPNLGFSTDELNPADWIGNISFELTSWVLPASGQFALFETNTAATSVIDVWFSTFDINATVANNAFEIPPGFHEHFLFVFTQPGTYELTFTISGTHVSEGFQSAMDTFVFQVIPEPSGALLFAAALAPLLLASRFRKRNRKSMNSDTVTV